MYVAQKGIWFNSLLTWDDALPPIILKSVKVSQKEKRAPDRRLKRH